MNFLEKYKPWHLNEIKGNEISLNKLKNSIRNFKKGKAVCLIGPTGVGKTASIYALGNDMGYEVLEINGSDFRNKEKINSIVGNASKQRSLFFKGKIVLVDEVDGISGREDKGGINALTKVIGESEQPIVLTGNDIWDSKFKGLRRKCEIIEFKNLNYLDVYGVLKEICEKEKVEFEENLIKRLARKAGGDLRAGINDLESVIKGKKVEDIELGDRERKESIFNILRLIFKSKDVNLLRGVFSNVDLDLGECFLWIDENLVKEYRGEDLKNGYGVLARADVYNGRIRRQQYYRFLVYFNFLMSVGVGLAKEKKVASFVSYKRPGRILKLWIAKQRYGKKKAIAEKISEKTHSSVKRILNDFDFYAGFLRDKDVVEELGLSKEEIDWIKYKNL